MSRPDNVEDLDQIRADDQLLDHAGSDEPARNREAALLRDIVLGGTK